MSWSGNRRLLTVAVISIAAAVAIAAWRSSQPQPLLSLVPNASRSVSVRLERSGVVAALQFDIVYDPAMIAVKVSASPAAIRAGKHLSVRAVAPGAHRVLLAGMNNNTLGADDISTIVVSAKAGAHNPAYSLSLFNCVAADATGSVIQPPSDSGPAAVYRH